MMTDEEKAEEYATKECCTTCKGNQFCKEKCECWTFAKKGAEFGYNKFREELNQTGLVLQSDMDKTIKQNIALKKELNNVKEWHYVKDGDLPKENQEVLVYFTLPDKSKNDVMIAEFENNDFNYVDLQDVICWKEIVLPKEIKEK